MTTTHKPHPRRRVDVASLALLVVGLASGLGAVWTIQALSVSPLVLVPSVVACTIGMLHLLKWESPRQ